MNKRKTWFLKIGFMYADSFPKLHKQICFNRDPYLAAMMIIEGRVLIALGGLY